MHAEHYSGYVDPQHPLGGPDGLKDVLCHKDNLRWVAAAYFPLTRPTFKEIAKKFQDDFAGVVANNAQAFAVFVNQPLTISEREELIRRAGGTRVEIYHLERIKGLLDRPTGYGIRLEYLPNPNDGRGSMGVLEHHERRRNSKVGGEGKQDKVLQLDQKIDRLLERTSAIQADLQIAPEQELNNSQLRSQ